MVWLQVHREGEAVRLFSRRGFDWTAHYPAIVCTAFALPAKSFTLDGEAVICSGDGIAVFEDLHRRRIRQRGDAVCLRPVGIRRRGLAAVSLSDRKRLLAKAVGKRSLGIVLSEHTDVDIFRQVCQMGLEGVVSKRLSSPYRSGRSTDWLKIKNPNSPAMVRHREGDW
jgi:bifunctional non-homologous end joining protein LigD